MKSANSEAGFCENQLTPVHPHQVQQEYFDAVQVVPGGAGFEPVDFWGVHIRMEKPIKGGERPTIYSKYSLLQ